MRDSRGSSKSSAISERIIFTYLPLIDFTDVVPASIEESGGDIIIYTSRHVGDSAQCRFHLTSALLASPESENLESAATEITSRYLRCTVPPLSVYPHNEYESSDLDANGPTVSVSVSVNGGYDYTSISTPVFVLPKKRILTVTPESGPSNGMTALTISGVALHTAFGIHNRLVQTALDGTSEGLNATLGSLEGGLYCLFVSTDTDSYQSKVIEVQASILNSTALSCMTPEWSTMTQQISTGHVMTTTTIVRVAHRPAGSLSSSIYQAEDAQFSYYPQVTLNSISPKIGPCKWRNNHEHPRFRVHQFYFIDCSTYCSWC